MSSRDKIEPPVIKKKIGTRHPINQTKDFLLNLLSKMAFKKFKVLRLRVKSLTLICSILKSLILQDKCMILFM